MTAILLFKIREMFSIFVSNIICLQLTWGTKFIDSCETGGFPHELTKKLQISSLSEQCDTLISYYHFFYTLHCLKDANGQHTSLIKGQPVHILQFLPLFTYWTRLLLSPWKLDQNSKWLRLTSVVLACQTRPLQSPLFRKIVKERIAYVLSRRWPKLNEATAAVRPSRPSPRPPLPITPRKGHHHHPQPGWEWADVDKKTEKEREEECMCGGGTIGPSQLHRAVWTVG